MVGPHAVVGWLWTAFILLWLVLGQFNKKASSGAPRWSGWWVRLAVLVGVLVVMAFRRHGIATRFAALSGALPVHPGVVGEWVGVGLCVVGFAFAIWARWHLGRNWGMPMSLRQDHELVTSGPYAYVRHPIYSGIMLTMIGSALTQSLLWLLLFALYFAYFLFSARKEEEMMLAQFPDAYPAYRRRTKMLIPFVF
jgi:protein-S-isoprenylcysteine O-methyltransferase Ste14